MNKNLKKCTHQEVAHWIPESSFYAENQDMPYLLYEGDWTLEKPLDLDAKEFENTYAIIVTGNMTATQIYNEETDGSCGLVVLGDLTAQNIVVGGQEIFVAGNLKVDELYWGDYNHGELVVEGNIDMKVFIATDYSYDYQRFEAKDRTNIRYHLCDEKDSNEIKEEGEFIKKLVEKQCINMPEDEIYGWGDWLDRDAILKRLAKNKSVLLSEDKIKSNFEASTKTWLFPNFDVSAENIKKMLQPKYFNLVKTFDNEWTHLFQNYFHLWNNNIHFRLEKESSAMYIYDENNDFVFYLSPYEKEYLVDFRVGEETEESIFIDAECHPEEYSVFKKHWESWLQLYSKIIKQRQKFVKMINKESFEGVFHTLQTHKSAQKKKFTDKKTGEVYHKIRSEFYDDGTIYLFYPPNDQHSGKIIALSEPDYKYIYMLDKLDRVKVGFMNDDNDLEEYDFDLFNHYTNAINFFKDILREME